MPKKKTEHKPLLLADIMQQFQFAGELCDTQPDCEVLYCNSGRLDAAQELLHLRAAMDDKISRKLSEGDRDLVSKFYCPSYRDGRQDVPYAQTKLRGLLKDTDTTGRIETVAAELFKNASFYGFDAFTVERRVDTASQVGPHNIPVTTRDLEQQPESHISLALVYSKKDNALYLLVQNIVVDDVISEMKSRLEGARTILQNYEGDLDDLAIPGLQQDRKADVKRQPLLGEGGPINTALGHVMGTSAGLPDAFGFSSGRTGSIAALHASQGISIASGPVSLGIPLPSPQDVEHPETLAALTLAMDQSGLSPDRLRRLTVTARIDLTRA